MSVSEKHEIDVNVNLIRKKDHEPVDFEKAIEAAGFGKFNYILLLAAWPSCLGLMFQPMTMSYVFPAAQCDLELTLENKGMLNAITFAGMMTSALMWGYVYDKYGRRKWLCVGFLLDGAFVILSALSQNFVFLMVTKFMGGFVISGPFSSFVSYLAELHSAKYRARVPMIMGVFYASGATCLPLLGSLILTLNFKWALTNHLVIHPWGLFLLITAIPSILGGCFLLFLPESPKFLMSIGEEEQALSVFKKIFKLNTSGKNREYPYEKLVKENNSESACETSKPLLKKGWDQMHPLFVPPLLRTFILVCSSQILLVASFNTLRLWMPQLFQAINDYKAFNNGTSSTLCEMLRTFSDEKEIKDCFVNLDNFEVYVNSMIVSLAALLTYSISGYTINMFGQNRLLMILSLISGSFAVAIYLSPNSVLTTISIALCSSATSVGTVVSSVVIINQFPTKLRATTLSLSMMFGRVTAMLGNVVFPYLLEMGCAPPFFTIAGLGFACAILTLLLPKQNENFE